MVQRGYKMKKIFAPSYTSFYLFIVLLGVLHFLYFQELRQTMPRIPGLKSILPFIFFSILFGFYYQGYMQFKRSIYILYSILISNVKKYTGIFVLLWHNSSLLKQDTKLLYKSIVESVCFF
jgi:small-conductance mechanosensitive channel